MMNANIVVPVEDRVATREPQVVYPASVELARAVYELALDVEEIEEGAVLELEVAAGGLTVGRGAYGRLGAFKVDRPGRYTLAADVEPLLRQHFGHSYARAKVTWACDGPTRFGVTARMVE